MNRQLTSISSADLCHVVGGSADTLLPEEGEEGHGRMRSILGMTSQEYDDFNRINSAVKQAGGDGAGQREFQRALDRRRKAIKLGGLGG